MRIAFAFLLILFSQSPSPAEGLGVEDIFGRRLNEHGLMLVDWEGPIANPAIKFFVVPPPDAAFPARVVLTCRETRVYFNLPSDIGARGPRKVLEYKKREKQAVFVSLFPNRQGQVQDFALQLEFQAARGRKQALSLPCHVLNQDRKDQKTFAITVDFSRDRTGFFKDEKNRQVLIQAAQDWAYFFDPGSFDPVPIGKEKTFIWDSDGFQKGQMVVNSRQYTGYLLYAYGIHSRALRSGGEPSREGGFQSQKGRALPIRRSGGVEIETRGNYNSRGWLVSHSGRDFWKATNLAEVPNDLYSIAHHEIGHALFFNPANPLFSQAKKRGMFKNQAIREYLGADLRIDRADHFAGAVDTASRRGAFGNEYHGEMPQCRWQITKLDLLCARAIGYPLRETSAFAPLRFLTRALPGGNVGNEYSLKLQVTGGIPFYHWEVTAGSLPAGLKLNSFTGAISGTPLKAGVFQFTIRVRGYEEKAPGESLKLLVEIGAGRRPLEGKI